MILQLKSLYKLLMTIILGQEYWIYRTFKKFDKDYKNKESIKLIENYSFAIIIQGPVMEEDSFTFESIKIYRRNFPEAILILSTWDMSIDLIQQLKKYNVHVIENQRPKNPGISNINLQITTARSGVLLAKKLGAGFALKTRTDQRIYHPSLDVYLINLIKAFPLKINQPNEQNERMVAISLNTFKYRLYGVSDMFLFGHIDDMCKYWDAPFDERIDSSEEVKKAGNTWQSFSNWRVCEVYLCANFIEGLGRKLTFTLRDYYDVLKNHFIVIDQSAIKLYWKKYTLSDDRYAAFNIFDPEISFNDWLVIFQSLENIKLNESFMHEIQ